MSGDANWADVVLLVRGGGKSNGSTSIVDLSDSAHSITLNGGVAISTAQSKFNGSSIFFDGVNDYLSIAASLDYAFSSGAWTIEGWLRQGTQGLVRRPLVDNRTSNGIGVFASSGQATLDDRLTLENQSNSFVAASAGGTKFTANTWQHWAVSFTGGTAKGFLAGNLIWTATGFGSFATAAQALLIGKTISGSDFFSGYLDELRVTKGVARYTASFTAPTTPFPTTYTASGISAGTAFGTPAASATISVSADTIASTTSFGTPTVVLIREASSVDSTVAFGTPALFPYGAASIEPATTFGQAAIGVGGAISLEPGTTFGTPAATTKFNATSVESTTVVPSPVLLHDITAEATSIGPVASVGEPVALSFEPVLLDQSCLASSVLRNTAFGNPAAGTTFTGDADGIASTLTIGEPVAQQNWTGAADGIDAATAFGTAQASQSYIASSIAPGTAFETPTSGRAVTASSIEPGASFGLATASNPNTHTVYSIEAYTSFGQPTALNQFRYFADSIEPATEFGEPDAIETHKAASIYRTTVFGAPTLQRNAPC